MVAVAIQEKGNEAQQPDKSLSRAETKTNASEMHKCPTEPRSYIKHYYSFDSKTLA